MEKHDDKKPGPTFTAGQARQGEIILRTRVRRIIFIVGIVGLVVLGFIIQFATHT
jgi:hypothetical protein